MPTPPDPDFRARVLGALDLSTDDLPTLHSVLGVQRACDREEASGPVYSSAALTRSSGNYPRRVSLPPTLEQAMESAAEWGDRVVLMLDIAGHRHRHVCTITQSPTDRAVFCLKPEVNVQWSDAPHLPATFAEVAAWGREHLPRVLSCEALESGQVVQQAMVRAVDSGMEVELTIEVGDRTVQHRCRVEREHPADKYVFGIRPELETRFESISLVGLGTGGPNRVTACVPVHDVAVARQPAGLALLPDVEPELRLPLTYRGVDFFVVEAIDDGWVMEAGHDVPVGQPVCGPLGSDTNVRQGKRRDTKAEAVVDAWALALELVIADLDAAKREHSAIFAGMRSNSGPVHIGELDVRLIYVPPPPEQPLPFGTVLCGHEEPEPNT